MKIFLKKHWGKLILATILLIICILSFKVGYSYISSDNYSPDLNPLLTIERSITSPAWRSYRVLGFASESEQADIFRSVFYYVLDIFLPTWSLSQIFSLLCFVVGSWFTALLSSRLMKDFGKKKYSELTFFLSGIVYISTLWTVWVYYLNMYPYISQFGFLPLLIWSIYRLVREFNWKNALITFVCSIVFTSTCVIATLFVVDVVVISFLTLIFAIFSIKDIKEILRRVLLTILLFVSTQLFWILPFVHYTANVSGDIVDSYTNQSITTSIIDLEKEAIGPLDAARMYTRILQTTDDNAGEKYLFEDAIDYETYDFYKFVSLLPAILGIIGIVFAIIKKKWIYAGFGVIAIVSWFLIKNQNAPFGFLFTFLQDNIPLFKQVFRWPSSKIGQVYIWTLSILVPFGFIYLMKFINSFFKKSSIKFTFVSFFTILLTALSLYFSAYLFEGKLFAERAIVDIPQEYFQLEEYLSENDNQGRVLYLPPANNGYFREYDWGFVGSGFLHYIIPNPLMDMSLAIGSSYGEDAMIELKNLYLSHDIEGVNEFINQYNIEYVLIDRNLIKGRYGYKIDWTTSDLLSAKLDLLWQQEDLYLYSIDNIDSKLTESLDTQLDTFTRIESVSPSITPLNITLDNPKVVNGSIQDTFVYEGEEVYTLLHAENIYSLPTKIVLEGNTIFVTPSIPTINGISLGISKTFKTSNYDYYSIDDYVFSKTQLESGITLDIEYGDLRYIYGWSNDWNTENITKYIANNSISGNCSGSEFEEDINVQHQGLASGFSVSGDSELPCMYSSIKLPSSGITKLNFNWETQNPGTYIGYCLYSNEYKRCVNDEKYIYASENIGEAEIILPNVLNQNDTFTLTIYAYSPTSEDIDVVFRNIELSTNSTYSNLIEIDTDTISEQVGFLLEDGVEYTGEIPIIYGNSSYVYLSDYKENLLWQINDAQKNSKYDVSWDEGIKQTVQEQYLNQYTTLFNTNKLGKYIWYWKGTNISNIPSTLCLTYPGDDKCWVEDMLVDGQTYSNINFFTGGGKRLDLSYRSSSYKDISENILEDFVVMQYPEIWEDIKFTPESVVDYNEYELFSGSTHSTVYSTDEQLPENSLITIPQASSNGWIAMAISNGFPKILNNRVVVNGWKQGWDISNVDYDSIYVIYYPNLLAYIGYGLLITEFVYICINLLKKRNG